MKLSQQKFKNSSYPRTSSWGNDSNCCLWDGVMCDSMSSHFGNLPSLTYLNLSHCCFAGEIPPRIAGLSKLATFDLSTNWFYSFERGNYLKLEPSTWEKLILNMTNMRELILDYVNMFSISKSSLSLLMNLSSSLVSLSLRDTSLQGNITNNILCLQNLQQLDLSRNQNLNGQLPKSECNSSLRHLDLCFTNFSGEVPNSLGYLKHLNHLNLGFC
ncbi:receptor-like protein 7 [Prosopis cineraria]|uniref:receptor-like protein 7 n=1 Tax=Prosopis cineraria TaxID=364024 RepID=UPI00240ED29C|nr:receptor-like protein 7 [Prosopis cineraria]